MRVPARPPLLSLTHFVPHTAAASPPPRPLGDLRRRLLTAAENGLALAIFRRRLDKLQVRIWGHRSRGWRLTVSRCPMPRT